MLHNSYNILYCLFIFARTSRQIYLSFRPIVFRQINCRGHAMHSSLIEDCIVGWRQSCLLPKPHHAWFSNVWRQVLTVFPSLSLTLSVIVQAHQGEDNFVCTSKPALRISGSRDECRSLEMKNCCSKEMCSHALFFFVFVFFCFHAFVAFCAADQHL